MNTNMNKPFELKVIVAFEEMWDDCKGGIFKLIGVVEERREEE